MPSRGLRSRREGRRPRGEAEGGGGQEIPCERDGQGWRARRKHWEGVLVPWISFVSTRIVSLTSLALICSHGKVITFFYIARMFQRLFKDNMLLSYANIFSYYHVFFQFLRFHVFAG